MNDRWLAEFLAGPACPGCGMTHCMVPASPGDSMANHRPLGLWPDFARCLRCRHFSEVPAIVSRTWARFALLVARGEVPYTCAGCDRWLDLCCCDERPDQLCKWCDAPVDDERPWHCEECDDCYNVNSWMRWPEGRAWVCARLASGMYTIAAFRVAGRYANPALVLHGVTFGFALIRMAPTNRQLTAGPYPRPVPGAGIVRWWQPDDSAEKRWYGLPAEGDRAVIMLYAYEVDRGLGDGPSYYPLDVCEAGGMTELDIIRQAFGQ